MSQNFLTHRVSRIRNLRQRIQESASSKVALAHPAFKEVEECYEIALGFLVFTKVCIEPCVPLDVTSFQPGETDFFFGVKMRVEGSFSNARSFDDLLDPSRSIALLVEQSGCDIDKFISLGELSVFLKNEQELARPVGRVKFF